MKKYFRTAITVEVLSEYPFDPINLAEVHEAITTGDCSGVWRISEVTPLTEKEMAAAAREQGTDPGFFLISDDDGMAA